MARVSIVTETKCTTTETTQDVDFVQEDVQARVSKPLVRHNINMKRRGNTDGLSNYMNSGCW